MPIPPMVHYVQSSMGTGPSGDFQLIMPMPSSHNRVALVAAQIPKTYWMINPADYISYSTNNGANWVDCKISNDGETPIQGNYSVLEWAAILPDPLFANYNQQTGRLQFIIDQAASPDPPIIKFSTSHMAKVCGFVDETTMPFKLVNGEYVIESPNNIKFTATDTIWVLSDIVVDVNHMQFGQVLSHFFANGMRDQSYVIYNNPAPDMTAKELNSALTYLEEDTMLPVPVRFRILDDDATVINFQGHDVHLVLRTWKENDMYELLSSYVEMVAGVIKQIELDKEE